MVVKILERRRFVRHACVGALPAKLIRKKDNSPLACQSIDASRLGLGLQSVTEMDQDEELILDIINHPIALKVIAKSQSEGVNLWRYGLIVLDEREDLEAQFRASGLITSQERAPARGSDANKPRQGADERATRFGIDWELPIDTKVFGSRTAHRLYVANISRSGMLVTTFESHVESIRANMLIDIALDPEKKYLPRVIHGFAKVIRQFVEKLPDSPHQQKVSLGIVISEIFPEDKPTWESFMRSLEREAEAAQSKIGPAA